MKKIEIPEIIFVNGIYLTKSITELLDYLQTGGTINHDTWDHREFDNGGLSPLLDDFEKIKNYLFEKFIVCDKREMDEFKEMFIFLSNIKYHFEQLTLPPDLIAQLEQKRA